MPKINIPEYFTQTSERLVYRALMEHDVEGWVAFFENNDRLRFFGMDLSKSNMTLSKEWIDKQLERYANEGLGLLAVEEKLSGEFIGMGGILYRNFDGIDRFEIAYSLKPAYWKKGFGTEIAKQMHLFGKTHGISDKFISIIAKENTDSIHVAEKNGMHILKETVFLGMDVFVYGT